MFRKHGVATGTAVSKYINRFSTLRYTGTVIKCVVCNITFLPYNSFSCKKHVRTKRHIANAAQEIPYWKFLHDFIFMLSVCNIPQYLVDNENFGSFWKRYVPKWPLPSRRQVRFQFPKVKDLIEHNIRSELSRKPLWVTVNETTDAKNNKVGNVLVRVLHPEKSSKPYLIASKRIENNTAAAIEQLVLGAFDKYNVQKQNVLILVTDGAVYMLQAGTLLKAQCFNLLHITCLLHACHLVTETIRNNYPGVDKLIASTTRVFAKARKRSQAFHRACPQIPEPPQPVLTRWGTWLQAAFYYDKNFEPVKSVISKFDPKDATAIKDSQQQFGNAQIQTDLAIIRKNYEILVKIIDELQNSSLSLRESLQIIDGLNAALHELTDDPGVRAAEKFKDVLSQNPDYAKVRSINERLRDKEASDFQRNFTYANVTSLDVERSFSKYSETFSSKRRCLSEDTLEGILMMQVYAEAHKSPFVDRT